MPDVAGNDIISFLPCPSRHSGLYLDSGDLDDIPEVADLACVGAAVLAGVGCGIYQNVNEGYSRLGVGERVLFPDPENTKRYSVWFEKYKRIAKVLGDVYKL